MSAVYPDMFAAASEFSGEPAGCFYTGTVRGWNSQCAGGQLHKTPAQWAEQVHAMYPGYSGNYPRMQVFHGDVDKTLNIASFNESIKEWSGIFGYSGNPTQTQNNSPGARLTKYIRLQGIWGHGFGHVVPTNETEALKWFGITVCIYFQYCSRDTNKFLVLMSTRQKHKIGVYNTHATIPNIHHTTFPTIFSLHVLLLSY
jgi:acetylxylan esterase